MKTADWQITSIGAATGLALGTIGILYAYHANRLGGVSPGLQWLYLLFFPSSFGLMGFDSSSQTRQVIGEVIVVLMNGAMYGVVTLLFLRGRRRL